MLGTSDFGACCVAILLFPAQAVHGAARVGPVRPWRRGLPRPQPTRASHARTRNVAGLFLVGFGITLGAP
jgi:hypothetical protein